MKNANKRDVGRTPKTRFNSRDRSKETRPVYSPRLKSFPAEKIKKLDNPPMFSPDPIGDLMMHQETAKTAVTSPAETHNGHGDATSTAQLSSINQQLKPPSTPTMNQQQVVANHEQIDRANAQSDSLLTRRIGLPERQAHRPYVPNVYQEAAICDRSPRNPPTMLNQPMIIQSSSTQDATQATPTVPRMQQFSSDSHTVNDQNCSEVAVFDSVEFERQPVGGRNTENHRQMVMQAQQQRPARATIAQDASAPLNDRFARNCQNVCLQETHRDHLHNSYQQQIPQQIAPQQLQHEIYHPPMSQQAFEYASSMVNNPATISRDQQFPAACYLGQGMTSPQDLTLSQMKLTRRNAPVHQRNLRYPGINPQSQDEGWAQAMIRDQPRYYCQTQSAHDRQNFERQVRSVPSSNRTSYKSANQQPTVEIHNRRDSERKMLQFTPDMIRDQELLVSTMRQQGVPGDVMRRQFDALLNEQRRHLAYIAQFQQDDISEMRVKRASRPARRQIENDEKPEWMIHITPPRISYNEMERIRAQQRASNVAARPLGSQPPEEVNGAVPAEQQNFRQQLKEETIGQTFLPQQCYRTSPHLCPQQHHSTDWSRQIDHQTPRAYVACCPNGHHDNTPNHLYHQQPSMHHIPYNSQHAHPNYQKNWSKEHTVISSSPLDNRTASTDLAGFQSERSVEPCSLLKMRVYKEMIRPQKRNNGLQDPDTIQKVLEALKDTTTRKGLEYLANLTKKKPAVRLNGIQESDEIPEDLRQQQPPPPPLPPTSKIFSQACCKRVSANGLENGGGSLGNRVPRALRPKRTDEPVMMEYPRQKQHPRSCHSVQQVEKENGTMENSWRDRAAFPYARNAGPVSYDRQNASVAQERRCDNNSMHFQCPSSSRYHQAQQYCPNGHRQSGGGQGDVAGMQRSDAPDAMRIDRAGGDTCENAEETTKCTGDAQSTQRTSPYGQPDIRETRTIDCTAHPARKPDYGPSDLVVSSDKLMASRHLQPPMIL